MQHIVWLIVITFSLKECKFQLDKHRNLLYEAPNVKN